MSNFKVVNVPFEVKLTTNPIKKCLDPIGFIVGLERIGSIDTKVNINNFEFGVNFREGIDNTIVDFVDTNRPKIIASAVEGSTVLSIDDTDSQLLLLDCIKIDGYAYQVVKIEGSNITLNKGIKASITASVEAPIDLTRVGNNGEYYFEIVVPQDLDVYRISLRNKDQGIYKPKADLVEIVEYIESHDDVVVL